MGCLDGDVQMGVGRSHAGERHGHRDRELHPVSTMGGDTLVDVGSMLASPLPRFVASNNTQRVIDISICTTTLLFPYVTNQLRFDTGLVITNTSEEAGSCTIEYSGSDAPDDDVDVPARRRWGAVGRSCCQLLLLDSRAISRQPVDFGMRTALPSSPTAILEGRPPWRRAISRFARVATRKTHRAAAPRVRK